MRDCDGHQLFRADVSRRDLDSRNIEAAVLVVHWTGAEWGVETSGEWGGVQQIPSQEWAESRQEHLRTRSIQRRCAVLSFGRSFRGSVALPYLFLFVIVLFGKLLASQ